MKKFGLVLVFVSLLISGCVSNYQLADGYKKDLLAKGKPKIYTDGFYDGCVSWFYNTLQKDVNMATQEKQYEMGWNDGYAHCKQRSAQTEAAFRGMSGLGNQMSNTGRYK